jgi:hypothetical protein
MAPLIRFIKIEIESTITFNGRTKQTLKYPARSLALISLTKLPAELRSLGTLPEIYLQ